MFNGGRLAEPSSRRSHRNNCVERDALSGGDATSPRERPAATVDGVGASCRGRKVATVGSDQLLRHNAPHNLRQATVTNPIRARRLPSGSMRWLDRASIGAPTRSQDKATQPGAAEHRYIDAHSTHRDQLFQRIVISGSTSS